MQYHYYKVSEYFRQTYSFPVCVPAVELVSFGLSLNHGVHGLQVRRVRYQRQRDVPVRHAVDAAMVHPQVVLHVAGALRTTTTGWIRRGKKIKSKRTNSSKNSDLISCFQFGVKLTEDLLQLFPDHVGQDVETTPERHRGHHGALAAFVFTQV